MIPDKVYEKGPSDGVLSGRNERKPGMTLPPVMVNIPVSPGIIGEVELGDAAGQEQLFQLRETLNGMNDLGDGRTKKEKKEDGGVKDAEMGWLETKWDNFVHSRTARWLGLGAGVGLAAANAACEATNSTPPIVNETAPVPTSIFAPTEKPTIIISPTLAPTLEPTLVPTKIETPTPKPSPTPEIVMHAGIPATIEQCDVLHPDTPVYEEEMRKRRAADRIALAALNGNVFFKPSNINVHSEQLPLPYKEINVNVGSILSCSTYDRGGERIIRFGLATSPDTMIYIDYNEPAAKNFILSNGGDWDEFNSFETLFTRIKNGPPISGISFGIFYDRSGYPVTRPNQNGGFEGVWEFFDAPLPEFFTGRTIDGFDFTVADFAMLGSCLNTLSNLDSESQRRVLEAAEKYIWPGALISMTQN